jgi:glycosyltransferase involved in cell wall biosynthesis
MNRLILPGFWGQVISRCPLPACPDPANLTQPTAALFDLERRLDRPWFRRLGWCAARWHGRPRWQGQGSLSERDETYLGDSAQQLGFTLSRALRTGALESAARIVEKLLDAPGGLERTAPSVQAAALETLLMLGSRDRAVELAVRHTPSLVRTANGMSMIELLDLPGSTDFLPNGRPNLLRLSRRVATRQVDVNQLAALLQGRITPWLRSPELHLLFFNALIRHDPGGAIRFLNRFLQLDCALTEASLARRPESDLLGALRFQPCSAVQGPLVSVLVAAHNAAPTIGYALDSLVSQSYQSLEILVGDDASTDGTLDILRRRLRWDARIRVFRSPVNQGAYNLRNALARHAQGEILAFHDADDLALPHRLARQVQQLRSRGKVACVANWARISPDGAFVFHRDQKAIRLSLVSLMLTRSAFEKVGPFRSARVGADLELYTRLMGHYGVARLGRIRSLQILGLWSPTSATRSPGTQSLEDGYRSPGRRRYSELAACQWQTTAANVTDETVRRALMETGNFVDAADIHELS